MSAVPVFPDEPEESAAVISDMDTEGKSVREGTVYYDIRFRAIVPSTREQIGFVANVDYSDKLIFRAVSKSFQISLSE